MACLITLRRLKYHDEGLPVHQIKFVGQSIQNSQPETHRHAFYAPVTLTLI